jgi:acyl-CoA thioesterase-1
MHISILRLWLLVVVLSAGLVAAASAATNCVIPAEFTDATTSLPSVAAALEPGGHLAILAVGSATVLGPDNATAGSAFPYQMADSLRAAHPGVEISVDVEGSKGMAAAEQLDHIRAALGRREYRLVLWQTGTVEAVHGMPTNEFAHILADGAGIIAAAGADLLLIDPQFSRFLQTNADVNPYEAAMQQASAMPGVLLFRRYELMRGWVADGRIDLEHATRANRLAMAETLHACLGQALATLVTSGVGRYP